MRDRGICLRTSHGKYVHEDTAGLGMALKTGPTRGAAVFVVERPWEHYRVAALIGTGAERAGGTDDDAEAQRRRRQEEEQAQARASLEADAKRLRAQQAALDDERKRMAQRAAATMVEAVARRVAAAREVVQLGRVAALAGPTAIGSNKRDS